MYGNVCERKRRNNTFFGCFSEFVIQGQSTGTPNICINLLKLLTIYMNDGIDPIDLQRKSGSISKKFRISDIREFYLVTRLYSIIIWICLSKPNTIRMR